MLWSCKQTHRLSSTQLLPTSPTLSEVNLLKAGVQEAVSLPQAPNARTSYAPRQPEHRGRDRESHRKSKFHWSTWRDTLCFPETKDRYVALLVPCVGHEKQSSVNGLQYLKYRGNALKFHLAPQKNLVTLSVCRLYLLRLGLDTCAIV